MAKEHQFTLFTLFTLINYLMEENPMPYNSSNPSIVLLLSQLYHALLSTDLFGFADYLDGPTPAPTYEDLFGCLTPVLDLVEIEPLETIVNLLGAYVEGRKTKKPSTVSDEKPSSDDAVAPKVSTPTYTMPSVPYCPYVAPAATLTLTTFDAYLKALLSNLPDGSSYSFTSYKKADDPEVVVCKVNHEKCVKPLYVVAYDAVDAFAQVAETFGEGIRAIEGLADELGMKVEAEEREETSLYRVCYGCLVATGSLENVLKWLISTKNDEGTSIKN